MNELKILANTLDNARQLTKFYLKHTSGVNFEKQFTIGEFTTHSLSWTIAHLAWAEDFLILKGVGGKESTVSWLNNFKIGSEHQETTKLPEVEEILLTLNEVHDATIALLNDMQDSILPEKNLAGLVFSNGDTKRVIINHCIRHEGVHCGHIGWILRMHGKKII